jgi:hypothetical protein
MICLCSSNQAPTVRIYLNELLYYQCFALARHPTPEDHFTHHTLIFAEHNRLIHELFPRNGSIIWSFIPWIRLYTYNTYNFLRLKKWLVSNGGVKPRPRFCNRTDVVILPSRTHWFVFDFEKDWFACEHAMWNFAWKRHKSSLAFYWFIYF